VNPGGEKGAFVVDRFFLLIDVLGSHVKVLKQWKRHVFVEINPSFHVSFF
jgi:hypothetical protein